MLHLINFDVHQFDSFLKLPNSDAPDVALSFVKRVEGISGTLRKPPGKSLQRVSIFTHDLDENVSVADVKENATSVSFTIPSLRTYNVVAFEWI